MVRKSVTPDMEQERNLVTLALSNAGSYPLNALIDVYINQYGYNNSNEKSQSKYKSAFTHILCD